MALIKRIDKGSPITAVEMDANLQYLEDSITAGTSGTSGTSGAGTSGTSGTSGAGTSGSSGTSGAGTAGSSGTSGTSLALSLFDGDLTRLTGIRNITLTGLSLSPSGSGGATINNLGGGGGGSTINVQSGSTTISSVSTLRVDASTMTLTNNGGGTVTIGVTGSLGGGGGTSGSGGTSGTNGSAGTSISLTLRKDALTLDSIRDITLSGSIFLDVSGSGGALLRVEGGGIPVVLSGVVSSSQQIVGYDTFAVKSSANSFNGTQTVTGSILSTGIISGSDLYVQNSPNFAIPQGNIMVGASGNRSAFLPTSSLAFNGLTVTDQGMNITFTDKTKLAFTNDFLVSTSGSDGVLISSLGGGGGSGAGFPFSGSAVITGSLLVSGSLTTTGPITAPTFAISSVGTPTVESATNINLTAGNAVVITSSSLRLAIFTDAQTSSITAQNGDMIYNSTAHKFMGYASGSWVQLH